MKVVANGIGQYYLRHGSGPAVVLIHALGLDHRLWDREIASLARHFSVFAYDVRGHGQSDIPIGPYTIPDFADDLQGLFDALGIESAHLVGISMGGIIAQEFALSRPTRVRSLVLADTTSEYNQDARRLFAERARVVEERGLSPLLVPTIERWFTEEYRASHPDEVDRIMRILAGAHPAGYAASCRAIVATDLTERLVSIGAPTTVLVGSADASTTPEMALQIHEHIPGSRYEVIPGAAHLTNVAAPEAFISAVVATIRRAELGGIQG